MPKKDYGAFDQPSEPDTAIQVGSGGDKENAEPSVGERISETAGEAGESVRESTGKVGETVEDAVKEATDRGKHAIDLLSRYAQEQPLASLAIAFAAGIAITGLLKR